MKVSENSIIPMSSQFINKKLAKYNIYMFIFLQMGKTLW